MAETPKRGPDPVGSRNRSPRYPGVPLDVCIERAQTAYDIEHTNAVPADTLLLHWGYKNPTAGAATVGLSAMRKFGLLDQVGARGARTVKLSNLALDILLNPNEVEKKIHIQTAALLPTLHAELWSEHMPSDDALKFDLVRNRGFTDSGAADFLQQFRRTIAFAGLESGAIIGSSEPTDDDPVVAVFETTPTGFGIRNESTVPPPPASHAGGTVTTIPVPLSAGTKFVQITAEFPLSDADWKQFTAVLEAMKPGLVTPAGSVNDDADRQGQPDQR